MGRRNVFESSSFLIDSSTAGSCWFDANANCAAAEKRMFSFAWLVVLKCIGCKRRKRSRNLSSANRHQSGGEIPQDVEQRIRKATIQKHLFLLMFINTGKRQCWSIKQFKSEKTIRRCKCSSFSWIKSNILKFIVVKLSSLLRIFETIKSFRKPSLWTILS